MFRWIPWLLVLALLLAGCQRGSAPVELAKTPSKPAGPLTLSEDFRSWPPNSLLDPDRSGTVERISEPDPERGRLASSHAVPDWANPAETLSYATPKGAKVAYYLMRREESLRAQDDATLASLLAGKKSENETPVFARPWRGWFGESGGTDGNREYRLRIYHLFRPNLHLELHLEWPNGNKEALAEGETLAAHLIYSIDVLKAGG
jgi:hypothetical protein